MGALGIGEAIRTVVAANGVAGLLSVLRDNGVARFVCEGVEINLYPSAPIAVERRETVEDRVEAANRERAEYERILYGAADGGS